MTAEVLADTETEWHPCLKVLVRCRIYYTLADVRLYVEATNSCSIGDLDVCPRVLAGFSSGQGNDLCGPPKHAEQEAVKLLPEGARGARAHIYGHTWSCRDCQNALVAAGVRTFVITGEPA